MMFNYVGYSIVSYDIAQEFEHFIDVQRAKNIVK